MMTQMGNKVTKLVITCNIGYIATTMFCVGWIILLTSTVLSIIPSILRPAAIMGHPTQDVIDRFSRLGISLWGVSFGISFFGLEEPSLC